MYPKYKPFRQVHLWELTELYVLLNQNLWLYLSAFLRKTTISELSKRLKIQYKVLTNFRDSPQKSISVKNLFKICKELNLDFETVEKSIRAVRFSTQGKLEKIFFPFNMDIYSWRLICHIIGDGTIDTRGSFPSLTWSQNLKNQVELRTLIKRLSRYPNGKSMRVNYPKGLTYVIMKAIPELTISDLKKPKFVRFVIKLPPKYYDWKVQFITAFLLDDGNLGKNISFAQKNKAIITNVMRLCDQLGYDHSPYPPKLHPNGRVYRFRLYQGGVIQFYNDLKKIASNDLILGLWHKKNDLEKVINSYNLEKGSTLRDSREFYSILLEILGDHKIKTTADLRKNPRIKLFISKKHPNFLLHRLYFLRDKGFIRHIKNNEKRPSSWWIPPSNDPVKLSIEFRKKYGLKSFTSSKREVL